MKVNELNLSSLASSSQSATGAARVHQTERTDAGTQASQGLRDDDHLSELVRSLRSLAGNSPERQARIEQIARSYANGTYRSDSEATASKIIDDAFEF
jgi:anti-sigma28 factor (negative regulator of flagellin synthesis)